MLTLRTSIELFQIVMSQTPIPLVETLRGIGQSRSVENIHYGSIAVVDRTGRLIASAGDPNFMTFSRSTIKAFQASPFVNDEGVEELGITAPELALMCASHNGEAFHADTALSILKKSESEVSQLQCGCHTPYIYSVTDQKAPKDVVWDERYNNCSGKHSGFLAWCHLHGAPKSGYLEMEHPLQQAIRRNLSIWCDTPETEFKQGIDGCSAPNYALPLRALALGYARLADPKRGSTAQQLFSAMTSYPEYVSGTGRHDLSFMKHAPGDWVAKIGAEAVQLIGVRSKGLGIAVKMVDGNQKAVISATIETLRQLDLLGAIEGTPLAALEQPKIKNLRGIETGHMQANFKLTLQ
jgi:L-asparaginase II